MKQKKRVLTPGKIYMALVLAFFYLPIVYTVVFSFNSTKSLTHFKGFSLRWYEKMLSSSTMMDAIITTFLIAILATVISTALGTVAAIGMSRAGKRLRAYVTQVNDLPMMNPEIVTAIGLLIFFATIRIEKGFMTMLLAHIMFCTPYVMLSITPKLRTLDPNLMDAALDLGATPWQALLQVVVPQLTPGIVSGALVAFTMSFDDFIISYFVTGNGVSNISILVYTMAKRVNPSINAISTLVILIITLAVIAINVIPLIRDRFKKEEVQ
ncbi:MAG: ABC transporter permease [Butyricicoccaceae bacterium]